MTRIAVLCSGGVDSSVVLHKLFHEGYHVEAFYLKIWLEDELSYLGNCPWEEDLSYVKTLCSQLNITLHIIPLQKEYHDAVVMYAIDAIKKGLTPNPDMFCNKMVKLGVFYETIGKNFDYTATGHYAIGEIFDGEWRLKLCSDVIKDQTYFLAYSDYTVLQKTLFPLGNFINKAAVREYAVLHQLPSAQRSDSQGICFLGKIPFKDFVKHYCGTKKGSLIEYETNMMVGSHEGTWFYTIGQRQGIGLSGGPWYVVKKDQDKNYVYISKQYYSEEKNRNKITLHSINWLTQKRLLVGDTVLLKLRHGPHMHTALLYSIDGLENNKYSFMLEKNDQGIAAGQFGVIYDNAGYVYGGGIIG